MPTITNLTHAVNSQPTRADVPTSSPARERGFTLIEMLVCMLIIAIILAMCISTFRGSKRTTFIKSAQAVALTYADGVEAFMADNGQRAPVIGDPLRWPKQDRGPVDPLMSYASGDKQPYLRTVPEGVQSGMVDLITPGQPIQHGAQAVVEYSIAPGRPGEYTFRVWVVEGQKGEAKMACVVTNRGQLVAGEKRCA